MNAVSEGTDSKVLVCGEGEEDCLQVEISLDEKDDLYSVLEEQEGD